MALVKPVMRNLSKSQIKRDLPLAILFSLSLGLAYKFGVTEKRRQQYNDFYKNYDAEADFQRMKKANVFQCIDANDKIFTGY